MNTSSKESNIPSPPPPTQEDRDHNSNDQVNYEKASKQASTSTSTSSSTAWLRLKDPRIVRVSRAFGGKDRHSKVCTVRGLRDRRVRLSVPTAIQLYDLQDRLGLNQPSKVVDWLLDAAKDEIDELPPLPVPPGNIIGLSYPHSFFTTSGREAIASSSTSNQPNCHEQGTMDWELAGGSTRSLPMSNFWNSDSLWRSRPKDNIEEEKVKQEVLNINTNHNDHGQVPHIYNTMSFGGHHQWEPNSSYSSSSSSNLGLTDHYHNLNVMPVLHDESALSLSSSGSQFLVCPPGTTQTNYFGNLQNSTSSGAEIIDPIRQETQFQMLSSSNTQNLLPNINSPSVRPSFLFRMNSKLDVHSPNNSTRNQR